MGGPALRAGPTSAGSEHGQVDDDAGGRGTAVALMRARLRPRPGHGDAVVPRRARPAGQRTPACCAARDRKLALLGIVDGRRAGARSFAAFDDAALSERIASLHVDDARDAPRDDGPRRFDGQRLRASSRGRKKATSTPLAGAVTSCSSTARDVPRMMLEDGDLVLGTPAESQTLHHGRRRPLGAARLVHRPACSAPRARGRQASSFNGAGGATHDLRQRPIAESFRHRRDAARHRAADPCAALAGAVHRRSAAAAERRRRPARLAARPARRHPVDRRHVACPASASARRWHRRCCRCRAASTAPASPRSPPTASRRRRSTCCATARC